MKLNYLKLLDKIGNDMGIVPVHISRKSIVEDAISTGSLTCDLIIGGGWPAGRWVALFGPEQSAKSSLLYHTLSNVIRQDINAEFFDFEGSTDPTYLSRILQVPNLNKVFGVRKEIGTWQIAPQCRYFQADTGEPYFRYIHRILQALPDKVQHSNSWFYVYDKKPKEKYNEKLYKNTKRYWVEAEDSGSQIIWFIDSLAAMLPEAKDEKDESKELALLARMFSQYIPLVKSRLARKRCSVVAVNQIRMKPMSFGNPEVESGGNAPKHYSDIRLSCRSISNPFGKGQVVEEPCWDGVGIDKYRYIKIMTVKNKCFSPYRTSLMRIWVESKGESGRGLDPFFDVYQYLTETGQILPGKKKKELIITLPGIWTSQLWKWASLKELVLNPNKAEVYKKYKLNDPKIGKIEDIENKDVQKKLAKLLDIQAMCKHQIKTDKAFDLYFKTISGGGSKDTKEPEKVCGSCVKFHKHKDCMELEVGNEACGEWKSEEEVEEEAFDE